MQTLAAVLVGLIAILHLWFWVLEMFLWETPRARKIFRNTPEFAAATRVMAANQGLYNTFLAAGLLWGLSMGAAGLAVQAFFLLCVLLAGVYGGWSLNRKVFFVQGLPAAVALALLHLACRLA